MAILNSHEPDDCCGRHINKAMREGKLDTATVFVCPRCGLEWKPLTVSDDYTGEVLAQHWTPRPHIAMVGFPVV